MRSFLKKYRRLILGCAFLFFVIPCIPDAIKSGVMLIKSFSREPVRPLRIGEIPLGGDPIIASFPEGTSRDMVRAIADGNWEKVKDLVKTGASVNAEGEYRLTPLYAAVHFRQPEIFEYLLEQGADYHAEIEMESTIRTRFQIRLVNSLMASVALDDDPSYLRALLKFATPQEQEELFMKFIEWPSGTFRLTTAQQLSPKDCDALDREKIGLFRKAGYECKPIGVYPQGSGRSHRFYMWSELLQGGFPFSDWEINSLADFIANQRYLGREPQMFQDYPGMQEFCETVDRILPGTIDKIKNLAVKKTKANSPELQAEFTCLATEFSRAQLKRFESLRNRVEEKRKANPETLPEPERSEMKIMAERMEKALYRRDAVAVLNLLDRGAPVNGPINGDKTPMNVAERLNFPEMCQILINAGTKPSEETNK